jgi:hypothetical protein
MTCAVCLWLTIRRHRFFVSLAVIRTHVLSGLNKSSGISKNVTLLTYLPLLQLYRTYITLRWHAAVED